MIVLDKTHLTWNFPWDPRVIKTKFHFLCNKKIPDWQWRIFCNLHDSNHAMLKCWDIKTIFVLVPYLTYWNFFSNVLKKTENKRNHKLYNTELQYFNVMILSIWGCGQCFTRIMRLENLFHACERVSHKNLDYNHLVSFTHWFW